jgi:hypothetical protein
MLVMEPGAEKKRADPPQTPYVTGREKAIDAAEPQPWTPVPKSVMPV